MGCTSVVRCTFDRARTGKGEDSSISTLVLVLDVFVDLLVIDFVTRIVMPF